MKLQPKEHEEPEMNLTSLIDVVLLLLIFFMVSTTFVDESRIKLQLPQASNEPAAEQKKDPIEVAVTATGEYRVNGQVLINTSPSTLSAAVSKLAGERRDLPITIRADARATHPIMMIYSPPGATEFTDTPFLARTPYFAEVIAAFRCPVTVVRLMRLTPGSEILEHHDHDLEAELPAHGDDGRANGGIIGIAAQVGHE